MKDGFKVVGLYVLFAGLFVYFYTDNWPRKKLEVERVDTVFVDRIKTDTVVIEKQSRPVEVRVYLPDTIRRRAVERDTIITDVLLSRDELQLTRIAPNGLTIQSAYVLPELAGARVNHRGNVEIVVDEKQDRKERRKRKLRKIVQVGAVVGGFVLGIVL